MLTYVRAPFLVLTVGIVTANGPGLCGQDTKSILEIGERRENAVPAIMVSGSVRGTTLPGSLPDAERVRDRYANGKVKTERAVVLDDAGNYVNHGEYQQFSEKGELLVSGTYQYGKRVGLWTRFLYPQSARLLSTYPLNKMRPPFASTVEFVDNKMNGVWVISDRDKNVACQIELRDGQRHGTMTLFHPNGQVYIQSHYDQGVLNGNHLERLVDGKVVAEESYSNGRKQITDTQYYNNRQIKSVMRFLTAPQQTNLLDNWEATELATFSTPNERQLDGDFVTYHENGQVASKGSYKDGRLDGQYTAWYRTGETSASGQYERGQQVGAWQWRHPNGMKKAVATFVAGKISGSQQSWDEDGKAILR